MRLPIVFCSNLAGPPGEISPLRCRRMPGLALALALASLPFAARAAEPAPESAAAGAGAALATDPALSVEETLVVVGEKVERSLQDTTSSVAVTPAARIEQENLQTLFDVLNRTPNVTSMYGQSGFTIRGIPDEGSSANPLTTIYIDGAAQPSQTSDIGPTDLWDVAQVEIFRGPQSTLQGQNALAGAIVLRTEEPTLSWDARARLLWGDPSDRRVAFAGGGPLATDQLAFRIAVEDRDFDGFVDNPTRNTGEDAAESTLARAKLLWVPAGVEGLTARLGYTRDDRSGPYLFTYSRIDLPDFYDHRINVSNRPNASDALSQVANLEVDYVLGTRWLATALTSWSDADVERSYDNDFSPLDLEWGDTDESYTVKSQEVRLHYSGDRVTGLIGAYASDRDRVNGQIANIGVETPVSTIAAVLQGAGLPAELAGYVAGLYAQALPAIPVQYQSYSPAESENRALFADGELRMGDDWSLLGGFRYDRESYAFSADTEAAFAGTLPDPSMFGPALAPAIAGINQAVLALVAQAGGSTPWSTADFEAFLPKAGARWAWADGRVLAFTAQRAYRSGGTSFNTARSRPFAYDPEYTWNYELALRTEWLGGKLSLNANTYYLDWQDKQVTAFFGQNAYDYHTVNAGKAHLYGLELDLRHRASRSFDWYAALGHSRTKYDEFEAIADGSVDDYSGYEFAYAPRWTFSLGGNLRFGERWFANLNANFRDEMNVDIGAGNKVLASRTLVGAKVGYDMERWSAYLYGSNLLDEGYIQYLYGDDPFAILGAPRVVGLGLEYRW